MNQDWLAPNDFDRSESMSALVGGTDYTFLQAYAMGLNPEGFSNSATPRVEIDFENGLVTFTYYRSRDDVDYVVERRLVESGLWTSEGVTQVHSANGRLISAACPVSVTEAVLLGLRMELE